MIDLFDDQRFEGLPREGFELFAEPSRERRRRAILETIHPPLQRLGDYLVRRLRAAAGAPLHTHLPQLNWPPGYQPFCTWLTLSFEAQGYQEDAQLNIGVHADYVAVRLGWDTRPDRFGRFEFLCRHGGLGDQMRELMAASELRLRVFASARWPQGSRLVFESATDVAGSFDEVERRGVWWELGRHYPIGGEVCDPDFAKTAENDLRRLMPIYRRIASKVI